MPDLDTLDDESRAQLQLVSLVSQGYVGHSGLEQAVATLDTLEICDPNTLIGEHPDHDLRSMMRFLCTLVGDHHPDHQLAEVVHTMIGNPGITIDIAREVVDGHEAGETPGWKLRRAAQLLRAGHGSHEASRQAGVHRNIVSKVSLFIDAAGAQWELLRNAAVRVAARGGGTDDMVAETGCCRKIAQRHLRRIRQAIVAMQCEEAEAACS